MISFALLFALRIPQKLPLPSMSRRHQLFFCRYIYPILDYWSTNTVTYLYLFDISIPVICATRLGVGDTNWSTDMHSPGLVAGISLSPVLCLSFHFFRLAFANMHALQFGIGRCKYFELIIPCLAISLNLLKLMWPYFFMQLQEFRR